MQYGAGDNHRSRFGLREETASKGGANDDPTSGISEGRTVHTAVIEDKFHANSGAIPSP